MTATDHEKPEIFTKVVDYGGEKLEIAYRRARKPAPLPKDLDLSKEGGLAATAHGFTAPFNPRVYEAAPGIICEQDVAVTLRDGTTIYTDIYRPKDAKMVPVIVSWSHYGKRPGDGMSEWQVMGVPPGTLSRMAKFESPDPGYWCHHGYAVANVDPRGVGFSEGDSEMFSPQDAQDGYDFIEWCAQQPWCNGKVGMGGNSAVAMTQVRIAAQQPPHLACIAPWEMSADIYRESMYEGGVPALTFIEFIMSSISGLGGVDDQVENARRYPFVNAYWASKIPDFSKVRIPTYMCAGWSHFHLRGSIDTFRRIKSRKKWLRTHREFEWPDAYSPENIEDLRRFFDRYLKDIHNGWEMTPRVRLQVMDAYDFDYQTNRPEQSFPLKRTEYRRLYLDAASNALAAEQPATAAQARYDAQTGETVFDFTFEEETELTGFLSLHTWVEADGHDDMDLFLTVQKLDAVGNFVPWNVLNEPHPGVWGKIRVSRRELDPELSTPYRPVQAHTSEQKLSQGEIVPVDIEIVPTSRIWHPGEQLRLRIAGRYIRGEWFEPLTWDVDNRGEHVIHTGGQYDSYLQVPVIPPRYRVGDYVVR